MTAPAPVTHAEALDLAPLYVIGALDEHEAARVRGHLFTCPEPHAEFEELGAVVPHLADALEPVDAPPELRARILAAIAQDAAARLSPATPAAVTAPARLRAASTSPVRVASLAGLARFALPLAAAFVIAALAGWNIVLQREAAEATQRATLLTQAVATLGTPGTSVARLSATTGATGVSGFAVLPRDGSGYLVLVGLPEAPQGKTYQAWYLTGGAPSSAGLLAVEEGAPAVLAGLQGSGVERIAVTVEAEGGATAPTSAPIVAGSFEA